MIMGKKNKIKIIDLTNDLIDEFAVLMDEYRVFYGKMSNFEESQIYVSQLLNNDGVFFLLAISTDEKPIGFCTLFQSFSSVQAKKIFILNDLYVQNDHRRFGYGTQLLDAAIALAKKHKINFLKLETAKDNFAAQNLYEKHGWRLSSFHSYGFETLKAQTTIIKNKYLEVDDE